jgi:hypothetical protein
MSSEGTAAEGLRTDYHTRRDPRTAEGHRRSDARTKKKLEDSQKRIEERRATARAARKEKR